MVSVRYTLLSIWQELLLSLVRHKPADVEVNKGMAENSMTADLFKHPVLVRGRVSGRYRKKEGLPSASVKKQAICSTIFSPSSPTHSRHWLKAAELALDKTSCAQLYLVTAEGCGIGPKRLSCRHHPLTNRHNTSKRLDRKSDVIANPEQQACYATVAVHGPRIRSSYSSQV
jgi:hypothetical protein